MLKLLKLAQAQARMNPHGEFLEKMVPFWGTLNIRGRLRIPQEGTIM